MCPEMIGLSGTIFMFVLMFMGMPIGFCLAITGILGELAIFGWDSTIVQLGMVPYATASVYSLCVLPLFMLMGELAFESGLTDNAYNWVYRVIGRQRGGLAMSAIGASGIFAACTGSSIATAVTMARVSLPQMKARGYNDRLSTGAIAAGGTLGVLLPPSGAMILYSIISGASIGKMFIAGLIPGLILISLFFVTIFILTTINPSLGPAGEKYSLREIISGSTELLAPVSLFGIVLGGLWFGLFSPSEAGGIGAFVAMVICIFKKKRSSSKDILRSLRKASQSTAMIFLIIIGAMIFGDFMTVSELPQVLVKYVKTYDFSPLLLVFVLMVIYVFLGALMDELAVMLITIPVILPTLNHLGVDIIWFGILFLINQQMGLILPPVGMIVFVLAGVTHVPMYTIYNGILPFAIAMFIGILLVMFFPQICLWLPNMMLGK